MINLFGIILLILVLPNATFADSSLDMRAAKQTASGDNELIYKSAETSSRSSIGPADVFFGTRSGVKPSSSMATYCYVVFDERINLEKSIKEIYYAKAIDFCNHIQQTKLQPSMIVPCNKNTPYLPCNEPPLRP